MVCTVRVSIERPGVWWGKDAGMAPVMGQDFGKLLQSHPGVWLHGMQEGEELVPTTAAAQPWSMSECGPC